MMHVLKPLEDSQDLEDKYQEKLFNYQDLKEKAEREMADVRKLRINKIYIYIFRFTLICLKCIVCVCTLVFTCSW